MRLFRFIAQFLQGGEVYCEDCIHCVHGDENFKIGEKMCKASPLVVDCSEKNNYLQKGRKINIIKTYKPCKEVRLIKSFPITYDSTCWKFDKKVLDK